MASPSPSPSAAALRPSRSGGASPAPPPPPLPPQRCWLSGLVSGAGRLIAAVLGPDSSGSDSTTTATTTSSDAAAADTSPSASSSPASSPPTPHGVDANGDHDNAALFPHENDQLNQRRKEMELKDYIEGSLAIVSEIDSKDAIVQLLMQETYSRDECNMLINIIQSRVVDSESDGLDPGRIALPIAWQAGRQPETAAHSSFSPNISSPASLSLPARTPDFDSNAIMEARRWLEAKRSIPILTPNDRGPCTLNTDRIQSDFEREANSPVNVAKSYLQSMASCHSPAPCTYHSLPSSKVLKRSYSIAGDTLDESRRIRLKLTGNLLNISKFKQVDVLRDRAAATSSEEPSAKDHNAFRGFPEDARKQFSEVPLLGTDNPFGSTSSQAVGDHKNYDSTILMPDCNKDVKAAFPVKVEPLNARVSFEPHMMDLTPQKHDVTVLDDSSSVSKLMLKEDIETAPISSVGMQLQNGSRNGRRRGANTQRPTRTTTRSPSKGSRRQNNGITIKSENDLLEQSRQILMGQELGLSHTGGKRPVGRPRKARGR